MQRLRSHQAELIEKLAQKDLSHLPLSILAFVVPGGGKSWLPGLLMQQFPDLNLAWFVPRRALRHQAAETLQNDFGIRIAEADNTTNPAKGSRGFVATHAAGTSAPELYVDELRRKPYILVPDEVHHAKVTTTNMRNELYSLLDKLRPLARVIMPMTGTLDTNDNSFIWSIDYREVIDGWEANPDGSADIYIRYDRPTALHESALVPMEFRRHDGTVIYIARGDKEPTEHKLSVTKNTREESAAIFTALRTEIGSCLLEQSVGHWRKHGNKHITIVDRQTNAKRYRDYLAELQVGEIALAITEEDDALQAIERFKRSDTCNTLVTCAMAYEGLDVPSVTHITCLTHIRSIPWIEQMLARAWRTYPGKHQCWAFVPDDQRMQRTIDTIRKEELCTVYPPGEGPGPDRERTEFQPIVPVSSGLETVRSEMLDDLQSQLRAEISELCNKHGVPVNDPFVTAFQASFWDAIARAKEMVIAKGPELTLTEEIMRYRKEISDLMKRKDFEKNPDKPNWGYHQKLLYQKTGIIFETATLEELKRAARAATNLGS